ncbi:MAG: DUF1501 domain-containing protein [Planctomycetota bacterium]
MTHGRTPSLRLSMSCCENRDAPEQASPAAPSSARPTTTACTRIEDPYEIHDLHATIRHLMGIDHRKLTVRHDSRDMRLTDVHEKLIEGVIA